MGKAVNGMSARRERLLRLLDDPREPLGEQPMSRWPQMIVKDVPVFWPEVGGDVDDHHPLQVIGY
jgi:hypothetical protein